MWRGLLILLLLASPAAAGVCKGADPCKECVDCSACWYCDPKNPQSESCGKLRDQTAKQREEAARKRITRSGRSNR